MNEKATLAQKIRTVDITALGIVCIIWGFFPSDLTLTMVILYTEALGAVFIGTFWTPGLSTTGSSKGSTIERRAAPRGFLKTEAGETVEVVFGPVEVVPNAYLLRLIEEDRRFAAQGPRSMESIERLQAVVDGRR